MMNLREGNAFPTFASQECAFPLLVSWIWQGDPLLTELLPLSEELSYGHAAQTLTLTPSLYRLLSVAPRGVTPLLSIPCFLLYIFKR